ncbi:MAG: hypothetical protein QOI99_1214 [Actinomycetota bacterium]|nr:hypothetical protein [Actinomycetota bacterium]
MKQVVQNYKTGELLVADVPPPACKPGGVLVATRFSLISVGTELMKVDEASLSLLGKARRRPEEVRKVLDTVAKVGPVATYQKVMNKLDSYTPLGYSLCGVVVEVGAGAESQFSIGDVVACAGNEHALHAELNWVPVNLCVPVPVGVDPRHACFATVGAIALHGVRRGEVQLGETACVIGLGLVGQLVVRLLVAAGVTVVGIDPVPSRRALAVDAGALACAGPDPDGIAEMEMVLGVATDGLGADHVFLAAGGPSSDPVHAAARLARDRARVVDIGKTSLDLPWNEYYEKELDLRLSRSYGPGRYDDRYELGGIDYPAGYVRWTERRNLGCFLDLVARLHVDLDPLVSDVFSVTDAVSVYGRLTAGELPGVGFLFSYPDPDGIAGRPSVVVAEPHPELDRWAPRRTPTSSRGSLVRLGFIGAGSYATSMLLPHLGPDAVVELAHVATTTSLSAANAQRRFGFVRASTDPSAVLDDETIDAVFVVTRHSSHADLAAQALAAGKAVFIEKPLALTSAQLAQVLEAAARSGNDRLMVGFNRRFAPLLVGLRETFGHARGPTILRYLVNAGPLDRGSWYRDTEGEGTRFEGEGGHFIDTASWWLGARPVLVHATGTPDDDDALVDVRYDDGSVASIAYVTHGSPRFPKETIDVAAGGRTARFDNFRRASVWTGRRRRSRRSLGAIDKGQAGEVRAFVAAVRSGGPMPVTLDSLADTTRATLAVTASLATGQPQRV